MTAVINPVHPVTRLLIDAACSLGIEYECLDPVRSLIRFHAGPRSLFAIDGLLSCNEWLMTRIAKHHPYALSFLRHHGVPVVDHRSFRSEKSESTVDPMLAYCSGRYPVAITATPRRSYSRPGLFAVSNDAELTRIVESSDKRFGWTYDICDIPQASVYSALICKSGVIDIVELERVSGRAGTHASGLGLEYSAAATVSFEKLPCAQISVLVRAASVFSLGLVTMEFFVATQPGSTGVQISKVHRIPHLQRHCQIDGMPRYGPARKFLQNYFEAGEAV